MQVLEYVPGALLILKVASRSGEFPDGHSVVVEYDEETVVRVSCDCPGFEWHQKCHHVESIEDLVGRRKEETPDDADEVGGDPGGPLVEHPPVE